MGEGADDQGASGQAVGGGVDATTLALVGMSREKADALGEEQIKLIAEQTMLARLQVEELHREDGLRHWSLRVRHISDVMKLAFEFSVAAILLAIVVLIGGAVWGAAKKQFAIASGLDLSSADRAQLAKVSAPHG